MGSVDLREQLLDVGTVATALLRSVPPAGDESVTAEGMNCRLTYIDVNCQTMLISVIGELAVIVVLRNMCIVSVLKDRQRLLSTLALSSGKTSPGKDLRGQ